MRLILLSLSTFIAIFFIIFYLTGINLSFVPVYGHASPVTYEPSPNTIYNISSASRQPLPDRIVIDFTESPEIRASSIKVVNSNNEKIDNNDLKVADSPKSLSVSLDQSKMTSGVYTVNWAVLSKDDGHITKGSYVFTVAANKEDKIDQSQDQQPPIKNDALGYSQNITAVSDNVNLEFDIVPLEIGQNTFNLSVLYTNGTAVENIRDVYLEFNNPSKNLGPIVDTMNKLDIGKYSSTGSFLSQGGNWEIKITVQRIGEYDINQQIDINVKG